MDIIYNSIAGRRGPCNSTFNCPGLDQKPCANRSITKAASGGGGGLRENCGEKEHVTNVRAHILLRGDGGAQFGLIRHRAQYNISVQRPAEIINLAMDRARSALCSRARQGVGNKNAEQRKRRSGAIIFFFLIRVRS